MSQSIRCEPLPLFTGKEKAAGEAALCLSGSEAEFGEMLAAELAPEPSAQEKQTGPAREADDPMAVYGIVIAAPPIVPPPGVLVFGQAVAVAALPRAEMQKSTERPAERETKEILLTPGVPIKPEAILAQEQKIPSVPAAILPQAEQIAQTKSIPAEKASGILAAQEPAMLWTSDKMEETAQKGGTIPLEFVEDASFEQPIEVSVSKPAIRSESESKKTRVPEIASVEAFAARLPQSDRISESPEVWSVRPVEPVEVAEAIRTQVHLLRTTGQVQIEVVLRPDAQTQIHLSVERVNGQVQVQARCDRGDVSILEAHWQDIQNSLAAQGIRVEPLQHSSSLGTGFQDFSRQGQQRDPDDRDPAEFFIEQEHAARKSVSPRRASGTHPRGWQSWA
jgi:hypothetical protein